MKIDAYPNELIYRLLDNYNANMDWIEPHSNIIYTKQNRKYIDNIISKDHAIVNGLVNIVLYTLDDRVCTVMKYRYQKGYTLKAIGRILNISAERVRQIEHKAIVSIYKNFCRQYFVPLFWPQNQVHAISAEKWIELLHLIATSLKDDSCVIVDMTEATSYTTSEIKQYSKIMYDTLCNTLDAQAYVNNIMNIHSEDDIIRLLMKVS